jgi:hypothetical protein
MLYERAPRTLTLGGPLSAPTAHAVLTLGKPVLMTRAPRERYGYRPAPLPTHVSLLPGCYGDRSRKTTTARVGGPGRVLRAALPGPPA